MDLNESESVSFEQNNLTWEEVFIDDLRRIEQTDFENNSSKSANETLEQMNMIKD